MDCGKERCRIPACPECEKQARLKAEECIRMTIGLCAMEADWIPLTPEYREQLVRQTFYQFMVGGRYKLWNKDTDTMRVTLTYLAEVSVTVDLDNNCVDEVTIEGSTTTHKKDTIGVDDEGKNVPEAADKRALEIAEAVSWPVWNHNG